MSNRRRKRQQTRIEGTAGVSLFPFLAVLICTMGALLLLLFVLSQLARQQAVEEHSKSTAAELASIRNQLEMIDWEIEAISQSKAQTEEQLRQARLRLGHIEDHIRRLRGELSQKISQWQALQQTIQGKSQNRQQLLERLSQLQAEVARLQAKLEEYRQLSQQPAFAIVPYEGPFGTRRRPIYLECLADRVILQPEGIEFYPQDFAEIFGPQNPLSVALGAAREHLHAHGNGEEFSEPYPLLIVRPSGIAAFYAVQDSLREWRGEIGYELVPEDWQLKYPPLDSELKQTLIAAVEQARTKCRQVLLLAGTTAENDFARFQPNAGLPNVADKDSSPVNSAGTGTGSVMQADKTPASGSIARTSKQPGNKPSVAHVGSGQEQNLAAFGGSKAVESLAVVRGKNWALPYVSDSLIPLTRPIQLRVFADRVELVPERGLSGHSSIKWHQQPEKTIDQLVAAIWDYAKQWGPAGNGFYWRPVLKAYVMPGAEEQYRLLQALLDGSGLMLDEVPTPMAGSTSVETRRR